MSPKETFDDDWPLLSQMPRSKRPLATSPPTPISPPPNLSSASVDSDRDDTLSVKSGMSCTSMPVLGPSKSYIDFKIPDIWRPSIMHCIQQDSDEERRLKLDLSIRHEISRDLVAQMFSYQAKPCTEFSSLVAKRLVRKYPFMRDVGNKVSGFVSSFIVYVLLCVQ